MTSFVRFPRSKFFIRTLALLMAAAVLSTPQAEAASDKKFNIYFDITNLFLRSTYFVGGLDIGKKFSLGPTGGIVSGGYVLGGSMKWNFKGLGENSFYLDGQYTYWKTSFVGSWASLFAGYRWYIGKSPVFSAFAIGARYYLTNITYAGVSLGSRGAITADYYFNLGVSF